MLPFTHAGWISIWVGRKGRYSRWREVCQGTSEQDARGFLEWKYGQAKSTTRTLVLPIAETPLVGTGAR